MKYHHFFVYLNLLNKQKNDDKGITIYDVLITNKKNKKEKS